jgi:hypothetical protein
MKESKNFIDFSKHIHTVKTYKSEDWNEIREDRFWIEWSLMNWMVFINHNYWMNVVWDFWCWSFCRNFIPSETEKIYLSYFAEKAFIANNNQWIEVFDLDELEKQIEEKIKDFKEQWYEWDELEEIQIYYNNFLTSENEIDYICKIRNTDMPESLDYEDILDWKVYSSRFIIIYQAFNEICKRLKNNS